MKLKAWLTLGLPLGLTALWAITASEEHSDWLASTQTLVTAGFTLLREVGRLARWVLVALPLECVGGLACVMLVLSGLGVWAIKRRERVVLL